MAMAQLERQRDKSHSIPEITEWRRAYTPVPDFEAASTLAIPTLPALPKAAELADFWGEVRGALRSSAFAGALAASLVLGLGLMWWATGGEKSFDRTFGLSWCGYFKINPAAIAKYLPKGPRVKDYVVPARPDACNCGD